MFLSLFMFQFILKFDTFLGDFHLTHCLVLLDKQFCPFMLLQ